MASYFVDSDEETTAVLLAVDQLSSRGSRIGRSADLQRNSALGHQNLMQASKSHAELL